MNNSIIRKLKQLIFSRKMSALAAWALVILMMASLLVGLVTIARLPEVWRFAGRHYNLIYFISQVTTAVACFIYATVILVLRSGTAPSSKDWCAYIGGAYFLLCIQYLVVFSLDATNLIWVKDNISTLLSVLNNIFFLAAGLTLLNRQPFPKWNICLQFIAAVSGGLLSEEASPYYRFPDVMVSAICMCWLGYGLYTNIRYINTGFSHIATAFSASLRKAFATIVLLSTVAYFMFGIIYALSPSFARLGWTVRCGSVIETTIKIHLQEPAQKVNTGGVTPSREAFSLSLSQNLILAKLQLLDSGVLISLFFLKFVIFGAVFFLIIGDIIVLSANHAGSIFRPIIQGNAEFLNNSGITRSIVETTGANSAELYIKIPGTINKEFVKFCWPCESESSEKISESDVKSLVKEAMETGEEESYPNAESKFLSLASYLSPTAFPSKVAEPVFFHNAVIGCLMVESKPDRGFSPTVVRQVRNLAWFVSLEVQSYREKASLDKIGSQFSRVLFKSRARDSKSSSDNSNSSEQTKSENVVRIKDFRTSADEVIEILQDVLDPLATGLWVDFGFHKYAQTAGVENYPSELERLVENESIDSDSESPYQVLIRDLSIKQFKDSKAVGIGKIALLIPKDKDTKNHPILGRNEIYLRTVRSRTTAALVGIAQEYLNSIVQSFGVSLNQSDATNVEKHFDEIKKTASKTGLAWVVAESPNGHKPFGDTKPIKTVKKLSAQNQIIDARPYPLPAPVMNASHVMRYSLPTTGSSIWFGIRSGIYSNDLVIPVWEPFLDRFVKIADSALARIRNSQNEIQQLESEAAHAYEFATIAVTISEMMHQIINTTRDIAIPISTLRDAFLMGGLRCNSERMGEIIKRLPDTTDRMLEYTASFKRLSETKDRLPCNLLQAALQSKILYAIPLTQRGTVLEIKIDPTIMVAVPPHVAALAIANLVGNSKDAIEEGGTIKIEAKDGGDVIYCEVSDDGPGIPSNIKGQLFKRHGITTKPNGSGWGIYLIHHSLQEYRGSIKLVNSDSNGTTFLICFPKHK